MNFSLEWIGNEPRKDGTQTRITPPLTELLTQDDNKDKKFFLASGRPLVWVEETAYLQNARCLDKESYGLFGTMEWNESFKHVFLSINVNLSSVRLLNKEKIK